MKNFQIPWACSYPSRHWIIATAKFLDVNPAYTEYPSAMLVSYSVSSSINKPSEQIFQSWLNYGSGSFFDIFIFGENLWSIGSHNGFRSLLLCQGNDGHHSIHSSLQFPWPFQISNKKKLWSKHAIHKASINNWWLFFQSDLKVRTFESDSDRRWR